MLAVVEGMTEVFRWFERLVTITGVGCGANLLLCESFPQVAIDCPVTCDACGPEAPELPKTFGGCEGFIDAVNEVTTISIFVGSCDDITGFQVRLNIDFETIAPFWI